MATIGDASKFENGWQLAGGCGGSNPVVRRKKDEHVGYQRARPSCELC
ncbi:hypothetical protein [Caballeronia sp. AZ7_KS35]